MIQEDLVVNGIVESNKAICEDMRSSHMRKQRYKASANRIIYIKRLNFRTFYTKKVLERHDI